MPPSAAPQTPAGHPAPAAQPPSAAPVAPNPWASYPPPGSYQPAAAYPQWHHPAAPAYPAPSAYPAAWGRPAPGYQPAGYPTAWGYPAGPYPQPPRRPPSNAGNVLVAVLLVPVILFLTFVIVKMLSTGVIDQPPVFNPPQPTSTVPTQPAGTSTTQPGSTTSPGQYQNDGYQVPAPDTNPPALPEPQTYDQATRWMQNNNFYSQNVPVPVRCEIPNIDPSTASRSELQTYLNDIVACLMRVWGPELESAGFTAVRPSVTIYTGQVQSPCGKLPRQNAIYCTADQQVYYATDLPTLFPQYEHDPFIPLAVIAHEFGHAIQAQTGILYSEMTWQDSYDRDHNAAASNDISRRTEMQADCFAGQFVNSIAQSAGISQSEQQTIMAVFFSIGDDQLGGGMESGGDHGTGANRQFWLQVGLTNTSVGACNTYSPNVPDSQVR